MIGGHALVNEINCDGNTPLDKALSIGNYKIAKLLKSKGGIARKSHKISADKMNSKANNCFEGK